MQGRITGILENLKDEAHIQPIIYGLFEKADPEEVKKTIEDLQRSLDSKNEEVKKNLSANHEHLFSCTDMVERLRGFAGVSASYVSKIHELSQKLLHDFNPSIQTTSKPLSLVYQVTPSIFLNTCLHKVADLVVSSPALATKLYLLIAQTPVSSEHSILFKNTWVSMLTALIKQLRTRLQGSTRVEMKLVTAIYNMLQFAFGKRITDWLSLPKTQVFLIFRRNFSNFSIDSSVLKSDDIDTVLEGILGSLASNKQTTAWRLDPIEFMSLLCYLEQAQTYEIKAEIIEDAGYQCMLKRICDDLFNHGIKLEEDLQKLERRVSLCLQSENMSKRGQAYLQIYSKYVNSITKTQELVRSNHSESAEFDFEFVRRFYEQRAQIEEVEVEHEIAEENRLSSLIKQQWGEYCEKIVASLESKLDFVEMLKGMPDEFRSKDALKVGVKENRNTRIDAPKLNPQQMTAVEFLTILQNSLDECLITLTKLANLPESVQDIKVELDFFGAEAQRKFSLLISGKMEHLLKFIEVQQGSTDVKRLLKHLLFVHTIMDSHSVMNSLEKLSQTQLESTWSAKLLHAIKSTDLAGFLEELESLFQGLKVTWVDQVVKSFLARISKLLSEVHQKEPKDSENSSVSSNHFSNFPEVLASRISYPSLIPFSISHLDTVSRAKIVPQAISTTYDGFTHSELLAQLQP
jgi:hypothetical protein